MRVSTQAEGAAAPRASAEGASGGKAPATALLRLEGASLRFPGGLVAVDGIDLSIHRGEFVSLLGPSGCGKTTTLRMIAGFERPTGGRLVFEDRDITGTAPYERPINTVFQDYALFPHMSVSDNVGFGLSVAGCPAAERRRRVGEALDLVGLGDRGASSVGALSGGQRQRVALARAIVNRPKLLLLDEPLSALDAHLREQMQTELKSLQKRLGTTFLMVTHDQGEALAVSDRIVLMNRGRIEQVATPGELYDRPATRFAASFIGGMNLLAGRIKASDAGERLCVEGEGWTALLAGRDGFAPGEAMTVGWRPEELSLVQPDMPKTATEAPRLTGTVVDMNFHGSALRYKIGLSGGTLLRVDLPRVAGDEAMPLAIGARASVLPLRPPRLYPDGDG